MARLLSHSCRQASSSLAVGLGSANLQLLQKKKIQLNNLANASQMAVNIEAP